MLIDDDKKQLAIAKAFGHPEFDTDVDFGDALSAAFRTDNTIGAVLAREDNLPDVIENVEFNPWDHITEEEKADEKFVDNVLLADSIIEIDAVRSQQTKERESRQLLADAGADGFFASLAVGVFDPINFVPVGGVTYRTYKGGSSILRAGVATASVAASTTAAQEALLHLNQIERTFSESAVNVTGATFLGLALGSGTSAISEVLTNQQVNKIVKEVEESFDPEPKVAAGQDSVGAAKVFDDARVKGKKSEKLIKLLSLDPLSRTLTSESEVTRRVAAQLAESPIAFEGGISGQAVETLIKLHDGKYVQALEGHLASFKSLRKRGEKMNRKRFNELVSSEIRNPGSKIPEVVQAAEAWNKKLYRPMTKEAIDARLLDEGVDPVTAQGYLNRIWNKEKINGNLDHFTKTVSKWLKDKDPATEMDTEELALEIAQVITSSVDGRLPYDYKIGEARGKGKGGLKGNFKQRTFLIPDNLVEDFLENDIELLAGRYLRSVAPDIELVRAFDDVNMTNEIKDINASYDKEIKRLSKTDPKKANSLRGKRDKDVRDMVGMRDRIRGNFGQVDPDNIWARTARVARDWNYLRLMGGVVAASIPDVARISMAEGFANAFSKGLAPLIKNTKAFKLSADEAKQYGVGVDVLMGGRSEVIADVADYTIGGTKIERASRSLAQNFGKINLMDRWTAGVKQLHIVTMQNRIIPMLMKGDYDERLSQLGISKADAKNIGEQLKKHSDEIDGAHIANSRNWDHPALAQLWGGALRKESDRVIVIPGQEKPLFMSTELGKTVFQFRSFMFSATQRVLISGLQGSDKHFMQGILSLISIGMMSYAFKQWDADRPISDDPMVWLTEGIDRSGALGILMEANNTVEKMSANNFGIRPLLGASAPASRYASRSAAEAFLGPTFGSAFSTLIRVAQAGAADRDWSDSDTRALRRLLPYQNLSILRQGLDEVEKAL